MAKIPYAAIPTADDLGVRQIQPTTKVIRQTVDYSGMKEMGRSVSELGQTMGEYADRKGRSESAQAEADFYIQRNKLREETEKREYSKEMAQEAEEREKELMEEAASKIGHASYKANFLTNGKKQLSESGAWYRGVERKKETDVRRSEASEQLNKITDKIAVNGFATLDDDIKVGEGVINGLVAGNYVDKEDGVKMLREFHSRAGLVAYSNASTQSQREFLTKQKELAAAGEGSMIPADKIPLLQKELDERERAEFATVWVDQNYNGSLSRALAKTKQIKDIEQRKEAEERLMVIHRNTEAARSADQDRTYLSIYNARQAGKSWEEINRTMPSALASLSPDRQQSLRSLEKQGGKAPSVTPGEIQADMHKAIERASKTGNPNVLINFRSKNEHLMALEERRELEAAIGGKPSEKSKQWMSNEEIAGAVFPKPTEKEKKSKAMLAMLDEETKRGVPFKPEEVRKFLNNYAVLSKRSTFGGSSVTNLHLAAGYAADVEGLDDKEKIRLSKRFEEYGAFLGEKAYKDMSMYDLSRVMGQYEKWVGKQEADGVDVPKEQLTEKFNEFRVITMDIDKLEGNGYLPVASHMAKWEESVDVAPADREEVWNAFSKAHRYVRDVYIRDGQDPDKQPVEVVRKRVELAMKNSPIMKKYGAK